RCHREAADKNYPKAQAQMALAYLNGNGVARDPAEATNWLNKAVAHGFIGAQKLFATVTATNEVASSPPAFSTDVTPPVRLSDTGASTEVRQEKIASVSNMPKPESIPATPPKDFTWLLAVTGLVSALAVGVLGCAALMLLRNRLGNLETQMRNTQFELAQANSTLSAPVMQHATLSPI